MLMRQQLCVIKSWIPPNVEGELIFVAKEGEYTIEDVVYKLKIKMLKKDIQWFKSGLLELVDHTAKTATNRTDDYRSKNY